MTKHKYTKELLQLAVNDNVSFAGVLRYLGLKQAGGTQSYITSVVKKYNINTDHFTGSRWNNGISQPQLRKTVESILVKLPNGSHRAKTYHLRRAMIESGIKEKCIFCDIENIWNNENITLEIDHKNGDGLDNSLSNLRFLCPNCHSQQKNTNKPHKYARVA